ncbi:MAG: esterase family protein [Methylacidiphilales bacterium]|nr:esterase family protein [Candidatus Methylacidiphilales bacterium]
MALCHMHWFSDVLIKTVAMNVILPNSGSGPFPVLYLLHGLTDDYSGWVRKSRIESYVRDLPLIVVMPDGFRGFYTDNDQGPAYAQYIGEELPALIERTFPAQRSRAGRFVGGLSMGGYGALRIGLGYASHFASVTSHSGALHHSTELQPHLNPMEQRQIFGDLHKGSSHDLVHLAKKALAAGVLPRLRIDCGTEDFLLDSNRRYHAELTELRIPHEYAEFPGAHDWDYWDLHVRDALAFHLPR